MKFRNELTKGIKKNGEIVKGRTNRIQQLGRKRGDR